MYASTAWHKASIPVVALKEGGNVRVNSASKMAYFGMSVNELIVYLWWVFSSVMTAARVTSLPVPAVVGMATSGGIGLYTFSNPFNLDNGLLGKAARAPMALAQSMLDPPPRAMMAEQLY